MVNAIDEDFVRYAIHAEVVIEQPDAPDIRDLQYSSAEDGTPDNLASLVGQDMGALFAAQGGVDGLDDDDDDAPLVSRAPGISEATQQPIVKSAIEKLGRNDVCYCGSGKKFKNCHGR